jgi:hypothetical protein
MKRASHAFRRALCVHVKTPSKEIDVYNVGLAMELAPSGATYPETRGSVLKDAFTRLSSLQRRIDTNVDEMGPYLDFVLNDMVDEPYIIGPFCGSYDANLFQGHRGFTLAQPFNYVAQSKGGEVKVETFDDTAAAKDFFELSVKRPVWIKIGSLYYRLRSVPQCGAQLEVSREQATDGKQTEVVRLSPAFVLNIIYMLPVFARAMAVCKLDVDGMRSDVANIETLQKTGWYEPDRGFVLPGVVSDSQVVPANAQTIFTRFYTGNAVPAFEIGKTSLKFNHNGVSIIVYTTDYKSEPSKTCVLLSYAMTLAAIDEQVAQLFPSMICGLLQSWCESPDTDSPDYFQLSPGMSRIDMVEVDERDAATESKSILEKTGAKAWFVRARVPTASGIEHAVFGKTDGTNDFIIADPAAPFTQPHKGQFLSYRWQRISFAVSKLACVVDTPKVG